MHNFTYNLSALWNHTCSFILRTELKCLNKEETNRTVARASNSLEFSIHTVYTHWNVDRKAYTTYVICSTRAADLRMRLNNWRHFMSIHIFISPKPNPQRDVMFYSNSAYNNNNNKLYVLELMSSFVTYIVSMYLIWQWFLRLRIRSSVPQFFNYKVSHIGCTFFLLSSKQI